jgi:hypothetical protein
VASCIFSQGVVTLYVGVRAARLFLFLCAGKEFLSDYITCACEHCGNNIEFESSHVDEMVACHHCQCETHLRKEPPKQIPTPIPKSVLSIGDILIDGDKVITPNGIGELSTAQWVFSDVSRTESRIPPVAIILAIVFALLCLVGLLFLLMREEKIYGYAEVSVHTGNLFHKVQIPVRTKGDVEKIQSLVYKAQSLSAHSRIS